MDDRPLSDGALVATVACFGSNINVFLGIFGKDFLPAEAPADIWPATWLVSANWVNFVKHEWLQTIQARRPGLVERNSRSNFPSTLCRRPSAVSDCRRPAPLPSTTVGRCARFALSFGAHLVAVAVPHAPEQLIVGGRSRGGGRRTLEVVVDGIC